MWKWGILLFWLTYSAAGAIFFLAFELFESGNFFPYSENIRGWRAPVGRDIIWLCMWCYISARQHYKVMIIPSVTSRHRPGCVERAPTLNQIKKNIIVGKLFGNNVKWLKCCVHFTKSHVVPQPLTCLLKNLGDCYHDVFICMLSYCIFEHVRLK